MSHSTLEAILGHLLVLIEMLIVLEALHVTPAPEQRASLVGLLGPTSQQEARVLLARLRDVAHLLAVSVEDEPAPLVTLRSVRRLMLQSATSIALTVVGHLGQAAACVGGTGEN